MNILNITSPGFEIGVDILNTSQYVTRSELKPVITDLQSSILLLFIALIIVFLTLAFYIKKINIQLKKTLNELNELKLVLNNLEKMNIQEQEVLRKNF